MKTIILLPLLLFGCATTRSYDFTDPGTGKKCVMTERRQEGPDQWWASFQCGEKK